MLLVFLTLAAYGLGIGQPILAVICGAIMLLIVYAERRFNQQDAEWDKIQRAKQNLTLASESMIAVYDCEAAAPCVPNPAVGLQVDD